MLANVNTMIGASRIGSYLLLYEQDLGEQYGTGASTTSARSR